MAKRHDVSVDVVFYVESEFSAGERKKILKRLSEVAANLHPDKKVAVKTNIMIVPKHRNPKGIYPEIVGFRSRGVEVPAPKFPRECPICQSDMVESRTDYTKYACGGDYSSKPQIQNHTDYFWGVCGLEQKGPVKKT